MMIADGVIYLHLIFSKHAINDVPQSMIHQHCCIKFVFLLVKLAKANSNIFQIPMQGFNIAIRTVQFSLEKNDNE